LARRTLLIARGTSADLRPAAFAVRRACAVSAANSDNWQSHKQFIAKTGDCDVLGVRRQERLKAQLGWIPSWLKRLIREKR
jgi:hypothetical protein